MTRYFSLVGLLIFLSVAPMELLRAYILWTHNFDARWLVIKYMPLQVAVWIALCLTIVFGVVKLLVDAAIERRRR